MQRNTKRLTFALLIDWIASWGDVDYYQTRIISGVAEYAKENDINLMCFVVGRLGSPHEYEKSRNLLFHLVGEKQIDGLIILPAITIYGYSQNVKDILDTFPKVPTVSINESYNRYHTVAVDNYHSMRSLTDHLIEVHNCRRLAFLKGPSGYGESETRFRAFCDSLEHHSIQYYPELSYQGNFLFESGADAIRYFLENNLQFDGIISSNDNMAIGALTELHKRPGKIADNIPITGFDDAEGSRFHAMTTVRQSFYNQAKTAASMLHRLIKGDEVPMVQEVPSEIIFRSSCGCASSLANNTFIPSKSMPLNYNYENTISSIIKEFRQINKFTELEDGSEDYEQLLHYESNVVHSFFEELYIGKKRNFLNTWNSLIFWIILKKLGLGFLHDILSCIRRNILENLDNRDILITADNLFEAARVEISDAIQRTGASAAHMSSIQTDDLEIFGEALFTNLQWKKQMDLVRKLVPYNGINKCFIVLYNKPEEPLKTSRLILACDGKHSVQVGDNGITFDTLDILPAHVMSFLYQERFNVLVMALHQGDNPLGYALFGFDSKVDKNFEILRYRLGAALNTSLLLENIQNQALDLERQVHERTKELSETNKILVREVSKRKVAEQQLKKALTELKTYNNQLQTESTRDELTGLYNRRGFITFAQEHIKHSTDTKNGFSLLFGDLDGLKQINDNFGHAEGDSAIKTIGEILNKAYRSADIISRLSGDEFVVIISGSGILDESNLKKRLNYYCDLYNKTLKKPFTISLSTGHAYFNPNNPCSLEELLAEADNALYKEKLQKKSV